MRTKPMQLTVMAVAALAVFAVAAVMLLSGGNPAQATTTTFAPGDYVVPEQGGGDNPPGGGDTPGGGDPTPTPTPRPVQPTPEPCSSSYPDPVFNSGHLALFEGYWDAGEETLVNNPCPPTLRHVPPTTPGGPETHERTKTNANIGSTIFHATPRYKGTLVAATDGEGNRVATDETAKRSWPSG